ncbi:nitrate- and nitrite sensing domain-containing protein [Streptomyces sp. DSM 42041]|uniref:histidine kinase n=1 Tax=Streptomyces hazeniae TaxID=3075538 RepID=A0ABU2NMC4_9ACTN|nr:nitrate- and nitrite sensing domain-containing protein [Streptomyces sp. DSM 42041]MDT0378132.1 nitrate- and nitrite sensing domain-containing protein [Streptomyces sp. DSM 42041]
MRTKRLRKPGDSGTGRPAHPPRRTRVRNRLLASVALCSLAVLAAGAPGIVESSGTLTESQELVEQAGLHQQAIALAHSLSDERGDMVAWVAAGRGEEAPDPADGEPAGTATGQEATSDSQRARVDRQITELLASDAVTPPVRQSLEQLPRTRQEILDSSESTAYDAYQAYTAVIQQLHTVSRNVARDLPGDHAPNSTAAAAVATTESLPHLGRAADQASATRGLLRGAFASDGPARTLTEAARLARVREQGALADFEQTAGPTASETYDKTVTGTDVGLAERYIEQLTADPVLDAKDRGLDAERVVAALSARIDRMRSVQSSLATAEVARLEQQRDDDVVALEMTVGLVGACLLLAVGAGVHTARSLSRPLSVLRRGSHRLATAEEPEAEEPVRFHGRNDEFAEVVGSLNALRETAAGLHTRAKEAEADNADLRAARDQSTAERERLREEAERLRTRLEAGHGASHGTFVHLGLRTLGLVERQLGILEAMEAEESDPDDLATLFKLDHLATRMRRAGENLLLLAGAEHVGAHHAGPVPLLDVLRAAVSEIERYERVQIAALPPHAQVSGFAADDLSHLVAELLDNATAFSAPDAEVTLSAWMLEKGDIMLSVQDEGIGVAEDRLAELNARLGDPAAQEAPGTPGSGEEGDRAEPEGLGNGLYVVARLAARHGLRVQLREQRQGGVAAVVVVPRTLLPDRPVPGVSGAGAPDGGQRLPGSVAEANSNTLPARRAPATGAPAPAPAADETPTADEAPAARSAAEGRAGAGAEPDGGAPEAGEEAQAGDDDAPRHPDDDGPAARPADDVVVPDGETTRGALSPTATDPADGGDAAARSGEDASAVEGADSPSGVEDEAAATRADADEEGTPGVGGREADEARGTFSRESDGDGAGEHGRADAGDGMPSAADGGMQAATVPGPREDDAREHPAADHARRAADGVTDKGLPKRTPRHVTVEQQVRPAASGGANAEELRRRLGGFQRGAADGHRDAAAEAAAQGAADAGGAEEEAPQ